MKPAKRKLSETARQGNWLTTVPLVVVGIAYLYFWFLPNRQGIEVLRNELRTQRDVAAQEPSVRMEVAQTRGKIQVVKDFVEPWEAASPDEASVSRLFGSISAALAASGSQTQSFLPREPVAMAHLRKIPFEVTLQGELTHLFDALHRIEQLPAQIWIETFTIERPERQELLRSEASLVIFSENSDKSD